MARRACACPGGCSARAFVALGRARSRPRRSPRARRRGIQAAHASRAGARALRAEHVEPLGDAAGDGPRVSPLPGSYDASPGRRSAFWAPPRPLADVSVTGSRSGHARGAPARLLPGRRRELRAFGPFPVGETVAVAVDAQRDPHAAVRLPLRRGHAQRAALRARSPRRRDPAETQHFRSAPTWNRP